MPGMADAAGVLRRESPGSSGPRGSAGFRAGGRTLKTSELKKELAAGRIRPAYLLAGSEPLLRDEGLASIREAVLAGAAEAFNFDRLSGERFSPGVLADCLATLPVMAERRLVVMSQLDPKGGSAVREELAQALVEAVESLKNQETTVLVVSAPKVDKRLRWVKAFKDPAVRVDCDPPPAGREVTAFIEAEARRQGVTLASGAAQQLGERIGPQLLVLRGEIAKAALLAGSGNPVSREHIMASTGDVAERSVWDLTDAIGAGQAGSAVTLLGRMLATGAAPERILGLLAAHFRRLARVRGGVAVAGGHDVQHQLESQAKRYSARAVRTCLERIHATDAALKGVGSLSREMAIESLVIDLSG